jgi:hypothetical protein
VVQDRGAADDRDVRPGPEHAFDVTRRA